MSGSFIIRIPMGEKRETNATNVVTPYTRVIRVFRTSVRFNINPFMACGCGGGAELGFAAFYIKSKMVQAPGAKLPKMSLKTPEKISKLPEIVKTPGTLIFRYLHLSAP